MSQVTKRNADTAFADSADVKVRKKRPRRKGRLSERSHHAQDLENKKDILTGQDQLADSTSTSKPKTKLDSTKHSVELERRIRQPPPNAGQVLEQPKLVKKTSRRGKREEKLSKSVVPISKQKRVTNSWNLSDAIGGAFIDHDPILTSGGEYLILPTKGHVHIYSTKTSLLIRSILVKERDTICSCSLSVTDTQTLYVATKRGVLAQYNIGTGSKLGQWKLQANLKSIAVISNKLDQDSFVVITTGDSKHDEMRLYNILDGKLSYEQLLSGFSLHDQICVTPNAGILAVSSSRQVHLAVPSVGEKVNYKWFHLPAPGVISAFDVRCESSTAKQMSVIGVVVGLENGAIFVYHDVLSRLSRKSQTDQQHDLSGRKLHWHRGQVQSVKWSRDGNYIISGGDETVLVLWQLETNQQQFLPHLSTSILNIIISASGAEYALRLGDNSVMVLSTADLTPSSNISGLCLPANDTPMQLHPTDSNKLLAAVSIRHLENSKTSATHLQTYDIDSNLQLHRQALTRNVTTAINISPEGHLLQEPNITHLRLGFDGNWMATVEEWTPNKTDQEALFLEDEIAHGQTELVLRIWAWNADDNSWDLTTRIDDPHPSKSSSILALASNPASSEFATMGSDRFVKIWKPHRRVRDGVQIRNKAGHPLFNWSCVRTIHAADIAITPPSAGTLAYSEDGSVLAASWSSKDRLVHLIDPQLGVICMSISELLAEGTASMAAVGRHLLCLSNSFRIFDMITLHTTYHLDLENHRQSSLAVSKSTNTFAIATMQTEKRCTAISVFDIENPDAGSVHDIKIPTDVVALLSSPSTRGFIVVDKSCDIRRLATAGGDTKGSIIRAEAKSEAGPKDVRSLSDIFGQGIRTEEDMNRNMTDTENDSHDLTKLFLTSSTASSWNISDMFTRVSSMLTGVV